MEDFIKNLLLTVFLVFFLSMIGSIGWLIHIIVQ